MYGKQFAKMSKHKSMLYPFPDLTCHQLTGSLSVMTLGSKHIIEIHKQGWVTHLKYLNHFIYYVFGIESRS